MDKVSSVDLERAPYLKAFSEICAAYNFFYIFFYKVVCYKIFCIGCVSVLYAYVCVCIYACTVVNKDTYPYYVSVYRV